MRSVLQTKMGWAVSFLAPVILYFYLWNLLGDDALARIGYYFWVHEMSVNQAFVGFMKMSMIRALLTYMMPCLLGILGIGWMALWTTRPREDERSERGS